MDYGNPRAGSWCLAALAPNAGTVIAAPIDPYRPSHGAPKLYAFTGGTNYYPDWYDQPLTKITNLSMASGGTPHTWYVLRPKNWTYVAESVTKNDTTIVMFDNPGTYSTNYKYPLPPGVSRVPGLAADNSPASGDYVAFQLDNGAWHFSLVSSLSTLTITIATGTPNIDGAVATASRKPILFFFGAGGDTDPATGRTDPAFKPPISATTTLNDPNGLVTSEHPGDPMIIVNANATNASILVACGGVYAKH